MRIRRSLYSLVALSCVVAIFADFCCTNKGTGLAKRFRRDAAASYCIATRRFSLRALQREEKAKTKIYGKDNESDLRLLVERHLRLQNVSSITRQSRLGSWCVVIERSSSIVGVRSHGPHYQPTIWFQKLYGREPLARSRRLSQPNTAREIW